MIRFIRKLLGLECRHRFFLKDVCDIDKTPKCVFCNKSLEYLSNTMTMNYQPKVNDIIFYVDLRISSLRRGQVEYRVKEVHANGDIDAQLLGHDPGTYWLIPVGSSITYSRKMSKLAAWMFYR